MTSARVRWLLVTLVCVDVLLIAINVLGAPSFLSLDEEGNFPTWYSSAKLLGVAAAALWCGSLERAGGNARGRWAWPTLALLFVGLSMDETATAHERLAAALMSGERGSGLRERLLGGDAQKDAFAWPVLFAPIVVAAVYFLAVTLYNRMKHDRTSLVLGIVGCLMFLAAVVLEGPAVYFSPPMEAWGDTELRRYVILTIIEESAEVLGATLMVASLLMHAVKTRNPSLRAS